MMSPTANSKRDPQKIPMQGYKRNERVAQLCRTCRKMTPTLFAEIYRMHFGANYDPAQESTWCWLTNENIWNFTALCYTREDLLHPCMMRCKGHRPNMFLWMVEEFIYIMGCLHDEDREGHIVLGHELLLLAQSWCFRKRGGGR